VRPKRFDDRGNVVAMMKSYHVAIAAEASAAAAFAKVWL